MKQIYMKKNYYCIITILGILLSVLWVIIINTKPYSDFSYYNEVAKEIANGGQWGDTYTSIGYSIVLGFIYKIFGISIINAKIFNLVLTLLGYVMFYKLLRHINISEVRRKVIYGIFALFPNNIFYNSLLGTEILFTTIFILITLIYFSDVRYKYVIIGVLTGLNSIIKPFFIIFFISIFLMEIISKRKFLIPFRNGTIILMLSLMTILPWCYRNTMLIGEPTFISNNGGIVLYINNNSQNKFGKWMAASDVKNSIVNKKEYIKANATAKNKMLSRAAKKWIISHPDQFIQLGFKRLFNMYLVPDDINFTFNEVKISNAVKWIIVLIYSLIKYIVFIPAAIMMILSSVKIILNLINKKEIDKFKLYGIICFCMVSCTYFITEGQGRYSFPVIFIIIYFFTELFKKIV